MATLFLYSLILLRHAVTKYISLSGFICIACTLDNIVDCILCVFDMFSWVADFFNNVNRFSFEQSLNSS